MKFTEILAKLEADKKLTPEEIKQLNDSATEFKSKAVEATKEEVKPVIDEAKALKERLAALENEAKSNKVLLAAKELENLIPKSLAPLYAEKYLEAEDKTKFIESVKATHSDLEAPKNTNSSQVQKSKDEISVTDLMKKINGSLF